jgi:hypothetical protein
MLGFKWLFIPGIILLTFGVTLQAGATGAVKALKMSTKLLVGQGSATGDGEVTVPGPRELRPRTERAQDFSSGTS